MTRVQYVNGREIYLLVQIMNADVWVEITIMQNPPKFSLWCWSYTSTARLRSWSIAWLLWVVEGSFWILKSYFNIFGCKLHLCCTSLQWSQYKHLSNVRKKPSAQWRFFFWTVTHKNSCLLAPSIHVTALKEFCQSAVVFQWKGKNLQTAFLSPCRDSSIAMFLSSLFPDRKACLMKYCMGIYVLNGWMSHLNFCRKQINCLFVKSQISNVPDSL